MSHVFNPDGRPLTQVELDANEISLIVETVKETHGDQPVELIEVALRKRFDASPNQLGITDTTVHEWAQKIQEGKL